MPISATISVSMKVNLGNYESADTFMSVSGIDINTTEKEIADLLDGPTKVSYDVLKYRITARAVDLKAKRSGG